MRVTITVVVSVVLMVVTMALFSAGMHVVELGGQWLKSELGGGGRFGRFSWSDGAFGEILFIIQQMLRTCSQRKSYWFLFFFGLRHGIGSSPGQESDVSHCCNTCCSCGNSRSFNSLC